MEKRCRICRCSSTSLSTISENDYFRKQIQILFDIVIPSRTSSFVCYQCKEIVSSMCEFYMHVKKTQRLFLNVRDRQIQACRLCGCSYENLTSLFYDSFLPNHIYDLFKVEVTKQDRLPTVICEPCHDIINNNLKFYSDVRKAQEMFLNELPYYDCVQISPQYYKEISNILDNLPYIYGAQTSELEKQDFVKSLSVNNQVAVEENEYVDETNTETGISSEHTKEENITQEQSLHIENTEEFNDSIIANNGNSIVNDLIQGTSNENTPSGSDLSKSEDIKLWKMIMNYHKVILSDKQLKPLWNTNGEDIFICRCCNKSFKSTSEMFRHERDYFLEKYRPYRCSKCSRVFDTKDCRFSHKMLHVRFGDFKCDKCTKSFLHMDDFIVHKKAHTIEFSNTCPICELDFISFINLKAHGKSHRPNFRIKQYPYYCAVCGLGHHSKESTRDHILSHKLRVDIKNFVV